MWILTYFMCGVHEQWFLHVIGMHHPNEFLSNQCEGEFLWELSFYIMKIKFLLVNAYIIPFPEVFYDLINLVIAEDMK